MTRQGGGTTVAMYAAIGVVGVCAIGAFVTLSMQIGEDFAIPGMIALAITAVLVFRGPLGKAIARRIEGDPAVEVDEQTRADVDELRGRVAELEERLDFAERLLARHREPDRIGGT